MSFKPPAGVAKEAQKGLRARAKASPSKRGGLTNKEASAVGVGSGVQRATDLANRKNLSLSTVKRMKAFFARHERNVVRARQRGLRIQDSRALQAWALWGGDAGKRWSERVVAREERKSK